ncbi:MAG: succinate dehydrogenase, hydrophobic membrane anchor protein [Pseudomonadota bacterium]
MSNAMKTPLGRVKGLGSAKSGTQHFWHQRVSAAANILTMTALLIILAMLASRDWPSAIVFFGNPLVGLLVILALVSTCYHMWLGMQVVIEDYVHAEALKLPLLVANTFYAVLLALAGIYAVIRLGLTGLIAV